MSQVGIRRRFRVAQLSLRALATEALALLIFAVVSTSAIGKAFTVTDEIGLTLFDCPGLSVGSAVRFSPDGSYLAVWSERGRLDLNRVEDSLRFYRREDVETFLNHPDARQPSPVWVVVRSDAEGPVINEWRWLADSSGVAFLDGGVYGDWSLVLADLRRKEVEPLTSATERVSAFDVRDREHYVYTAFDRIEWDALRQKARADAQVTPMAGAGHSLEQILLLRPEESLLSSSPPKHLWAVVGGERFEVMHEGAPVVPEGDMADMALSRDGRSVVTALPVREVPSSWETLYPQPFESQPNHRIRAGHDETVHQYVRIDLQTGSVLSLTHAPAGLDAGWDGWGPASWSSDGRAVLLLNTFLSRKERTPSAPCVAVVDLPSGTATCVETIERQTDEDYQFVSGAVFTGGNKNRVTVSTVHNSLSYSIEYRRAGGGWRRAAQSGRELSNDEYQGLEVIVKEALDEPPLLVARDRRGSRVLWDPNPQLSGLELGHAEVYTWRDKEGREWKGGLYKPIDYRPNHKYPLVIQTHGFQETEFNPSGRLTTGSAARALAAAGVLVLQVGERCPETPSEGACAISGYESAVNRLVAEGMIDPENNGIIGFSRTGFYVMEALTASAIHFKAALIADSHVATYFQYIAGIDGLDNAVPRQLNTMIGAPPFGDNLQLWLRRSPGFNLDKIRAALLVVPANRASLLTMWEPYAGLRYLHKPADLIVLNTAEHEVTNPASRMASQGGSVDWFRFWLQGYEDSDPTKAVQYRRWESLCDMQVEQNPHQAAVCVRSKTH